MDIIETPPSFIEPESGEQFDLQSAVWRASNGRPLAVSPLPGLTRGEIDQGERSLWRYHRALPLSIERPISLGEGCTPLVHKDWNGRSCYFKLEYVSPTGSFKDRGAAVMLSYLRQIGVNAILEDSSGNGGAAIAAYGATAGMQVRVLVPAYAQPAKIAQIKAFGADVRLIEGPREATAAAAVEQTEASADIFYASHNWHPLFLHGTKTVGYELWEDFGFQVPDNIIIPTGAGSNVLGCDLAFQELMRSGEIDRLPRLFAVQPANCGPIDAHFQAEQHGRPLALNFAPTIAEGTAIKEPVRLRRVLAAVQRSGGNTVAVSEEEIVAALKQLVGMGLYCEPTCASAAAAFEILSARGEIRPEEKTVLLLTGSGLKASHFMTELFG